jgi:RsiW-degrading membrane proteinase PrsW (M82 family)
MAFIALAASIIATVVPTIVYVFVLWWFDRYEKEPIGLLAIAFFWGAIPAVVLSIIGEVIAGVPLSTLDAASSEMIGSSAIAPFVEESVKGLIVFVLYWIFYKEFDSPIDGIIYGALVGHGFGMTENLFYFLGAWANGGWASWSVVVFVRAFVFGLNHAFFTSLTGLGLYLARMSRNAFARGVFAILGLSAAMLFHAIHNLGIVMAQATCLLSFLIGALSDWGGVLIIFVILIIGMMTEKRWITSELKEEIELGLIDQRDYTLARSYTERMTTQIDALL